MKHMLVNTLYIGRLPTQEHGAWCQRLHHQPSTHGTPDLSRILPLLPSHIILYPDSAVRVLHQQM